MPVTSAAGSREAEGETSAHGSITRAREDLEARTKDGALRRPVPSVARNGTLVSGRPVPEWWPRNVSAPLRVSTECEPCDSSTASRPVDALRNVTLARPAKTKWRMDVGTPPPDVFTDTSSGKGQRPRSVPSFAAGPASPRVVKTAVASTTSAATDRREPSLIGPAIVRTFAVQARRQPPATRCRFSCSQCSLP